MCYVGHSPDSLFQTACLVLNSLTPTPVQSVTPSYQWILSEDSYLARSSPYCIYAVISACVSSFASLLFFFFFLPQFVPFVTVIFGLNPILHICGLPWFYLVYGFNNFTLSFSPVKDSVVLAHRIHPAVCYLLM